MKKESQALLERGRAVIAEITKECERINIEVSNLHYLNVDKDGRTKLESDLTEAEKHRRAVLSTAMLDRHRQYCIWNNTLEVILRNYMTVLNTLDGITTDRQ